ncbi:MAG: ATP-dependent helicase [Cyanobacteria bacterium J06635_15]
MATPPTMAILTPPLTALRDRLRSGQQRLADWQGGALAVSAVPGSGKSTGMAAAAAIAIAQHQLHARRQLVLVTFTRSAAANLKAKVRYHLKELGLPQNSFWVSTLHGLALNVASRNPELSGLNLETLTLVSPTQGNRLIRASVEQWIAADPKRYQRLIAGAQFDGEEAERLRRQSVLRTEILPALAHTVIHEAKSSGLLPQDLAHLAENLSQGLPDGVEDYDVIAIAAGLYERYQTLLARRDLIDYDDMVLASLRTLQDDTTRHFWQSRVFAIFEDEAQDSSPLQTQLLDILARDPDRPEQTPNLVRVGDPNQAINSTFTPADPVFFNQFCEACRQQQRLATIDQAGRSTAIIMTAANTVLDWVNQTYAAQVEKPFRPQAITAVGPQDPQPNANPPALGQGLEVVIPPDIHHTGQLIAQRLQTILQQRPDTSAAILVRENRQGRFISRLLQDPDRAGVDLEKMGIRLFDVGDRDRQSHIPTEMLTLLQFIERPHSPDYLKAALKVLVDRQRIPSQDLNTLVIQPETFLYPGPLDDLPTTEPARQAQAFCCKILRARLALPPYHLMPFLALTLHYNQSELATADKLAARVAQQTAEDSRLSTMIQILSEIASSERFEGIDTEDAEAIYTRKGQLTILTMHKAKGLDWDVVFLPFLQSRTIPGNLWVPPQGAFLGDFTLAEVARAQIRAHTHAEQKQAPIPTVIEAWQQAAYLKEAEEYRLLYVAMTRAKRLLWMAAATQAPFSWQKPDNLQDMPPCPALPMLQKLVME